MVSNSTNIKSYLIFISGLVQGVGFRPFVYRLAKELNIYGWVENRTNGVVIKIECSEICSSDFIMRLQHEAPPASVIHNIKVIETDPENLFNFEIRKSKNDTQEITRIAPDIAVCNDCLNDLKQQEHRISYPFINCTNCGPRFSIVCDLPYDREKTTMRDFKMCSICYNEYTDLSNRRFHAQPVACNHCGPTYTLHSRNTIYTNFSDIIQQVCRLLESGKIVAIKGIGGFHLACDAMNQEAVKTLRKKKLREGKPFAVMFNHIDSIKQFALINDTEARLLKSWQRPIVLLKLIKQLAPDVCVGFDKVGAMLPYMPIHYLMFEQLSLSVIVLTSGNLYNEPIVINNENALQNFSNIADAILTYNRDIHNRTDDSVMFVANKKPRIIRRSRGFVPNPIYVTSSVDGIFAAGAELTNCFCIGKQNQAILSQHIGDLKNIETYEFYTQTFEQFKKLFRINPVISVCDMHPDYLSTQFAKQLNIPVIEVQHHHAHIASCMAEYGLDEKVIGISFDGTGLGDDGNIWGGEILLCDLKKYTRYLHFEYIPMPGGDLVTKYPWRMAVSYLYDVFGYDFLNLNLPFLKNINRSEIELIIQAIDKKINSPLTSSCGRLFDAVAAILGVCMHASFHAEAPMRLESIFEPNCDAYYNFEISNVISFKPTIIGILSDIQNNISPSVISAKFHNTLANCVVKSVMLASKIEQCNIVVLSGGVFQNKYLLEKTEKLLRNEKFKVVSHSTIPSNDAGIALGQLVIASKYIA